MQDALNLNILLIVLLCFALILVGNKLFSFTFLKKQKAFLQELSNVAVTKVDNVKVSIERGRTHTSWYECDLVIFDKNIFLLLRIQHGNIVIHYQNILQLHQGKRNLTGFKHVGEIATIDYAIPKGRLLTISARSNQNLEIELQFEQGFDASKLISENGILAHQ